MINLEDTSNCLQGYKYTFLLFSLRSRRNHPNLPYNYPHQRLAETNLRIAVANLGIATVNFRLRSFIWQLG